MKGDLPGFAARFAFEDNSARLPWVVDQIPRPAEAGRRAALPDRAALSLNDSEVPVARPGEYGRAPREARRRRRRLVRLGRGGLVLVLDIDRIRGPSRLPAAGRRHHQKPNAPPRFFGHDGLSARAAGKLRAFFDFVLEAQKGLISRG